MEIIHNFDLSNAKKRVFKEKEWRLSLKEGSKVDVIKHKQVKDKVFKSWSRGTVVWAGRKKKISKEYSCKFFKDHGICYLNKKCQFSHPFGQEDSE